MNNLSKREGITSQSIHCSRTLKTYTIALSIFLISSLSFASPHTSIPDKKPESFGIGSPCVNTILHEVISLYETNLEQIDYCTFATEYNIYNNAISGNTYRFTASQDSWITVRSGSATGQVLGYGFDSFNLQVDNDLPLYVHYNSGPNCETNNNYCIVTSTQCLTCPPPPPANNSPCGAQIISCGNTIISSNAGATQSNFYGGICGSGTKPSVFYKFNAEEGFNYTITVTGNFNFDPTLILFLPNGDCDDGFINGGCGYETHPNGTEETLSFNVYSNNSPLRYIEVFDWNGNIGDFAIQITCTPLYDCMELLANINTSCDDGNIFSAIDTVNDECECEGSNCISNVEYGEISLDGSDDLLIISTCSFQGEYSVISNAIEGNTYQFTLTGPGGGSHITVRSGTVDGGIIGSGYSPLNVVSDVDGELFIHYSGNEFCQNVYGTCILSKVVCTSCVESDCPGLMANIGDPCSNLNISNGIVSDDCNCVNQTASLIGTADWNSSCGISTMMMSIYQPGTSTLVSTHTVTMDENGMAVVDEIEIGIYDIYIKINGHLSKGLYNITLSAGDNSYLLSDFTQGDLNNDNGINVTDVSILNSAFNTTYSDSNYNFLSDMNCDGAINIIDVSILNAGFGMVGAFP